LLFSQFGTSSIESEQLPKVKSTFNKTGLIGANRGIIRNILTNCEVSSKTKLKDVCENLYSQIINSKTPKRHLGATIESKADSVFSAHAYPASISVEGDQEEEYKPHISIQKQDGGRSKNGGLPSNFNTIDS